MSNESMPQHDVPATSAQTAKEQPEPKLVLALPDWEKRRLVIASDEVIDGERMVCVAIQEPPTLASNLPESAKVAGSLQSMLDSQHCKVPVFDAQALRQAIALLQSMRPKTTAETNGCHNCATPMCDRSTVHACGADSKHWTPRDK